MRHVLVGLVCCLAGLQSLAGDTCRIAYDIGSSGIRAGSTASPEIVRTDLDFLGRRFETLVDPTIAALNRLPTRAGFPSDCVRLGGGFSAWRLAVEMQQDALIAMLREVRARSRVAILVIPQQEEGRYGYIGSRQLLGEQLATSHVLDIGGGSLQISGAHASVGAPLGQKLWHRHLCSVLEKSAEPTCNLQPLSPDGLEHARRTAIATLQPLVARLPPDFSLTAVSRPVSRGVFPLVRRLFPDDIPRSQITLDHLTRSIDRLAPLDAFETTAQTETSAAHASYLLSDMLLLEGIMKTSGIALLQVAEIELTNIPGLLADNHAFAWAAHYGCYLEQLRLKGVEAYHGNPSVCPKQSEP